MRVSIIIPVYNVVDYIEVCLESVFKQTYSDIEVILVDDCGSDNSVELARRFIEVHKLFNCRIIKHSHNRGLSAARNTGLTNATGEYVFFLDSDDSITPDCIEKMATPLVQHDYSFVIAGYRIAPGNEKELLCMGKEYWVKNNEDVLASYVEGEWYMMAWNKLCNRDFLLRNNLLFEEGLIHEDLVWSFKLACNSESMCCIPDITYLYRIRDNSIMTGISIEHDIKAYLKVFDVLSSYIIETGRTENENEYKYFQGKRAGIMYSLLQKNEFSLFWHHYSRFHSQNYNSPIKLCLKGIISFPYMLRDLHYDLPSCLGRVYVFLFYEIYYALRNKRIEGAVWK